jgi:septum formation protein
MRSIVLASTSPYRRQLLQRLRLPFLVDAPQIDESPLAREVPRATALRLAQAKARAVAARHLDAIVIGSDQVADLDGSALSKPGSHARALAQLESLQGRTVVFHTALAVFDVRGDSLALEVDDTEVQFRSLARSSLDAYLRIDQPYDCAGAARIESLGIALVERIATLDPTALIGLPLIRLVSLLANLGVVLPVANASDPTA